MSIDRVRQAYDAFSRGDVPAILAILDPAVAWHTAPVLPHGGSFNGRDEVGRFFAGVGERWDGLALEFERFLETGDEVVVFGRATGNLRGHGETGYGFAHWFTFNADSITRFRELVDPDATLLAAR